MIVSNTEMTQIEMSILNGVRMLIRGAPKDELEDGLKAFIKENEDFSEMLRLVQELEEKEDSPCPDLLDKLQHLQQVCAS